MENKNEEILELRKNRRSYKMLEKIVVALWAHGLSLREVEYVTGKSKSQVHRLISYYEFPVIRREEIITNGHRFLTIHFPFKFTCPGCGRKTNEATYCVECRVFIPEGCENNEKCGQGFSLKELEFSEAVGAEESV